jgi:hypothetical protein
VDAELQSLLMAAANSATHDEAHMDALHQHLKSKAYAMGIAEEYVYDVAKSSLGIKSLHWDPKGYLCVGATVFD